MICSMVSSGTARLNGHAREAFVFGGRNNERFNVIAACRKQADNARERTRFIFKEDGDDVFHGVNWFNIWAGQALSAVRAALRQFLYFFKTGRWRSPAGRAAFP